MKKVLLFFIVLVSIVSCLNDGKFNTSYPIFATFEYGDLIYDADSLCVNKEQTIGLGWDYLVFYHKLDADKKFKGGFIASRLMIPASGVTEGLSNNVYRANTKQPKGGPDRFLVFCETEDMPDGHLNFTFVPSPNMSGTCTINSVYVNNTVAVADSVLAHFTVTDVLSLKAAGYLDGKKTGEAEIKLAEKDSIISNWTSFDLSKLGTVDSVRFNIIVPEGKPIPKAVCMDNLIANISLSQE